MRWLGTASLGATLVGAAAYVIFGVLHNAESPAYDTYAYFLPNAIHASRSLWNGGKGILWNPFNAAGGPFFANGVVGLLYPPHALFALFEPNVALHLVLLVSVILGGLGALLLAREWGLGWPAALGGALAFQLGDPMVQFVGWNPMITGPLVWVPWALLALERCLRRPDARRTACFAGILALQLLPGNVLVNALTYQVIAFRIAWEILTAHRPHAWRIVLAAGSAMVLAPLIVAVQIVPNIEFAQWSYRVTIPVSDWVGMMHTSIAQYRGSIAGRLPPVPFLVAPLALATIAPLARRQWRLGVFFLLVFALYVILALGDATPLFGLYVHLPPGGTVLHIAHRLLWVSGVCLCLLSALGLQAIADDRRRSWAPALVLAVASSLVAVLTPGGLRWSEQLALAILVVAGLIAGWGFRQSAVWIALGGLVLNLTTVTIRWGGSLPSDLSAYSVHARALTSLAGAAAPQYRLLIQPHLSAEFRTDLMRRTSTVFGFQNFSDYEVLPENRYVNYILMMGRGHPLRHATDILAGSIEWFSTDFRPRLLDLAAIRYVVASPESEPIARRAGLPSIPIDDPGILVYRNDNAFPRARWVPAVRVVNDASALLVRLAEGTDDLTAVALLESPPVSGYLGTTTSAADGEVHFELDDPEHVIVTVNAKAPGFLLLADHFYPGWTATVNGRPATVERANYLFRLVEVPAGRSSVEFRFLPTHFALGAGISIAAAGLTVALACRRT